MADVQDFLRESKVLYGPFMKFATTCSLKEFLMTFQSPFLVRQDLYQGELMEKTIRGYNPTVKFQGSEDGNVAQANALNKHIRRRKQKKLSPPTSFEFVALSGFMCFFLLN